MTFDRDKLNRWSEDEAFDFCVDLLGRYLRREISVPHRDQDFDFSAAWIREWFFQSEEIQEQNDRINASPLVEPKILSALWRLCLRGVLRPSTQRIYSGYSGNSHFPGSGYSFTESGRAWLEKSENEFALLSPQALSKLLDTYEPIFGKGFTERAHNAFLSFDCGAYLACCAMSGAACESIYLSLAVAKAQNPTEVYEKYRGRNGRVELQKIIEHNQSGSVIAAIQSGFNILKYWRDNTAHGDETKVGWIQARSALNALTEQAQIAEKYWTTITGKDIEAHKAKPIEIS